jgi:hypothetical protein
MAAETLAEGQRAPQQLPAEPPAAGLAGDDRAHEARCAPVRTPHEAGAALDVTEALRHQEVVLGIDPVAIELGEQVVLALPERVEHEVGLAPGAAARQRCERRCIGDTEGADRHVGPPATRLVGCHYRHAA